MSRSEILRAMGWDEVCPSASSFRGRCWELRLSVAWDAAGLITELRLFPEGAVGEGDAAALLHQRLILPLLARAQRELPALSEQALQRQCKRREQLPKVCSSPKGRDEEESG